VEGSGDEDAEFCGEPFAAFLEEFFVDE